jgi:hypothetical protein
MREYRTLLRYSFHCSDRVPLEEEKRIIQLWNLCCKFRESVVDGSLCLDIVGLHFDGESQNTEAMSAC